MNAPVQLSIPTVEPRDERLQALADAQRQYIQAFEHLESLRLDAGLRCGFLRRQAS